MQVITMNSSKRLPKKYLTSSLVIIKFEMEIRYIKKKVRFVHY